MNDLGIALLWSSAKTTGVAVAVLLLAGLLRRGRPELGARLALLGLVGMTLAGVLALLPWPRWCTLEVGGVQPDSLAVRTSIAPMPIALDPKSENSKNRLSYSHIVKSAAVSRARISTVLRFQKTDSPERAIISSVPWGWPARIATAWLVLIAIGTYRFLVGVWAVARLVHRSRPVADRAVLLLVDELRTALDVDRSVRVRECSVLDAPATQGWFRPVLLLPGEWRNWRDDEIKASIAHELAHVRACDSPCRLVGQLCLALNYHHPLAHWLCGRLCLDQELAADEIGAVWSGGRRLYVAALARIALRPIVQAGAWAIPSLFRSRGILFRRIAMLLRNERLFRENMQREGGRSRAWPRWAFAFSVGVVAGFGLLLASMRGTMSRAQAQIVRSDEEGTRSAKTTAPFALARFLPPDSAIVVVARPAALVGATEVKAILDELRSKSEEEMGRILDVVDPESIDLIAAVTLRSASLPEGGDFEKFLIESSGVIVHTRRARDWKAFAALAGLKLQKVEEEGLTIHRMVAEGMAFAMFMPDEYTLIASSSANLPTFLKAYRKGKAAEMPSSTWKLLDKGSLAFGVDMEWLKNTVLARLSKEESAEIMLVGSVVSPIWERTDRLAFSVSMSDGLDFEIAAGCKDDASAEQVEKTLNAIVTLAGNSFPRLSELIRKQDQGGAAPVVAALTKMGDQAIKSAKVERVGHEIRLEARTDKQSFELLKSIPGLL